MSNIDKLMVALIKEATGVDKVTRMRDNIRVVAV